MVAVDGGNKGLLQDWINAACVSWVEDLSVVDYVIAPPGRFNEASIAEKKKRGSNNGIRNPKGTDEKCDQVPPGKGFSRPATVTKSKVQFDKGNQDKADTVWPRNWNHVTRPNQRNE
jgi:hypothetical protein